MNRRYMYLHVSLGGEPLVADVAAKLGRFVALILHVMVEVILVAEPLFAV